MFNKVVFEGSPYAYPQDGTEQSIKEITREDITRYYDEHCLPSNLILAFVGAISPEEALKIVESKFGSWQKKSSSGVNNPEGANNKTKEYSNQFIYLVDKPGAVQSNLRIGHIGIARNNPDFIAVTVMNTILGGYFGSRININLREKHGFTYGARSSFAPRIHPGDFSVDTDVRNAVTDSSITLVLEELNRIISGEVTDEELQTVKNYLTGLFQLQLETANSVATRVINLKLYDLPKYYYNNYISSINDLTKEDILNAAKKYIHPDSLYIVVSGNSKQIKDKLSLIKEVKVYDADDKLIQ